MDRGSIKAGESAAEFGVSTETIRKDILQLEKTGIAERCFGGAVLSQTMTTPAASKQTPPKQAISLRALEFVEEGSSIFLDGGTTTYALGERIALRDDLTVFTNSMSLLGPLSHSGNRVFIVGGRLQGPAMSNVGQWAVQAMRATNIDVAFLGTDGIGDTAGPTSASYDESEFKTTVMASSRQTLVLADSTKFTDAGLFVFSRWRDVDYLITDENISAGDEERLSSATTVLKSVPRTEPK